MGGISKQRNKEKGRAFEIEAIADIIKSKEAKGKDATYERGLLKSWANYEGYEGAKQALADCTKPSRQA